MATVSVVAEKPRYYAYNVIRLEM